MLTQSEKIVRPPRDRSIDVLKGLGIAIIAMGHIDYSGVGESFAQYLYMFNVALFFIVAGYNWRQKPGQRMWAAITQKFRQIYLPYVVLFTISILYGHLVVRYVFGQYVIPFEWKPTLKALLFSSEWLNSVPTFNFALWFLPLFFIASVAFLFLQKIRNRYLYATVLLLIVLASLPIQQLIPGRPILNINVVAVAVAFMGCGYLLKKHLRVHKIKLLTLLVLFAFTLLAAFYYPGNVSAINTYWYFPSALASFAIILRLAHEFRSSSLLSFIGSNSLLIFGIHGLIANSYPESHISQYLASSWGGLMLYLVNLVYVVFGSLIVVILFKKISRAVHGAFARKDRFSVFRR